MQYQQVELTIGKDGTITERVVNGIGKTCTDLTAALETALGEVRSQELLPEYNQRPIETEIQQDDNLCQNS
ncbi:DUF2997 domain-containing protein [Cylindrospermum sp. FACHB-282]|uniref:DUF2997 domain-containing protein n=1 Tax=Cylindrospermum sp. FACHB-282 TaxID=2692794 RepID=UPI00168421DF|nr:DUF2997 domain-containing protein [Cylindrospermum sp. FACHB-282]MBD2386035.1 DUF2997 domain-containing protein [Cylindrospermum sp. FACHB-282]